MNWISNLSFSKKILLMIFGALITASVIFGSYMTIRIEGDSIKRLDEKGDTINKLLAKISVIPILTRDYWSLEDYITEIVKDPEIVYAVIFDEKDSPITNTSAAPRDAPPGDIKIYRSHIRHNERLVGNIEIGISVANYKKEIKRDILFFFTTLLVVLVSVFFLFSLLSRVISRPVVKIVDLMKSVGQGDFSLRSDIASRDEFGLLARGFNEMLEHIQTRDRELEEYRDHLEDQVALRTEELAEANSQLQGELVERQKVEESLRQSYEFNQTVINSMHDSVSIVDSSTYAIVGVNKKFLEDHGLTEEQVLGKPCYQVTHHQSHPCTPPDDCCPLLETMETGGFAMEEHRHIVDGSEVFVEVSTAPIRDSRGEIIQVVHVATDITERKQAEEKIRYLAYFDSLTGLPNRDLFKDRVEYSISVTSRGDKCLAIMFVDLDNFKQINDTLGHDMGDELLREVARRMRESVRASDTLARKNNTLDVANENIVSRQGGDEFAILLTELSRPEEAAIAAERILGRFAEPVNLGGNEVFATGSIGITTFPSDGESIEVLFKNADTAMYSAKERGKNTYMFFDGGMNTAAIKRMRMESSLRKALQNEEFSLHYQPQVDLKRGEITGVEALLRWNSKELGAVSPLEFIPLAEETGLIGDISEWVVATACQQQAAWVKAGHVDLAMSINFSGNLLKNKNILEQIDSALQQHGLNPGQLVVEITENVFLNDAHTTIAFFNDLKEMGVSIAMDDFGTGYSSLSYLRKFPLDIIKIDRSFMKNVPGSKVDEEITRAIIDLAHILSMHVVAEGVETQRQLNFLQSHCCDEIQGFLVSKPMPPEKVDRILAKEYDLQGLADFLEGESA